ncbi:hypothetical protein PF005_g20336 [Phytophthora fragariae]|uniref:Retrotransposon gag domain-containing protein n=2 Tax=Phytophthora fragariae TaxID=53985 RepID=A0A6A3SIE4_9STRA|nr:hypothetical protein PF003_g2189 [Phytophthora fragariae]KAE8928486.1 hypothetical protein PF009_g21373 [Phytophthora fragariae]KAE9091477.1 hypothetical protein PF007_g18862 [Phytophthora fragariae]KAE9116862.1 hypothetical protein PF006_g18941 [Phytophthora fragariae]KAE9187732.1 hypothetical protein PF005_g20336 [Phytophthora fragariae]
MSLYGPTTRSGTATGSSPPAGGIVTPTVAAASTSRSRGSAKVSHKASRSKPLGGGVRDGGDSGGGGFKNQVETAQLLAGERWTEAQKKAVLSLDLTDMASTLSIQFREDNVPSTTLATCGKRFIEEFSSPLSDFEIIAQLRDERKRPMETYREYADRLVNMAGLLEGGIQSSTNVRFALDAFVQNAWPNFTTSLKIAVDEQSPRPMAEHDIAVRKITSLAGSDGKMRSNKRPMYEEGRGPSAPVRGDAHAAVIERKRKLPARRQNGNIMCFACGRPGHIAAVYQNVAPVNDED